MFLWCWNCKIFRYYKSCWLCSDGWYYPENPRSWEIIISECGSTGQYRRANSRVSRWRQFGVFQGKPPSDVTKRHFEKWLKIVRKVDIIQNYSTWFNHSFGCVCHIDMSPNLCLQKCKQQHLDKLKEIKTPWVLVGALNSGHSVIAYL